jgi:hypothetical protein
MGNGGHPSTANFGPPIGTNLRPIKVAIEADDLQAVFLGKDIVIGNKGDRLLFSFVFLSLEGRG